MSNLVTAISFGLAIAAFIVFILSGMVVYRKIKLKQFDDIFWFSLAIALGWFSTLYFRTMFILGHYAWLDTIMLCSTILASLIHIRTLSWHKYSRFWEWSALLISGAVMVAYWVLI